MQSSKICLFSFFQIKIIVSLSYLLRLANCKCKLIIFISGYMLLRYSTDYYYNHLDIVLALAITI